MDSTSVSSLAAKAACVRFGRASIVFGDMTEAPSRRDLEITLPRERGFLYRLKDGQQFLFFPHFRGNTAWFGGTDDDGVVFLTALERIVESHIADGETAFYQILKPTLIKRLEHQLGVNGTKRQGDIWCYPVGWEFVASQWRQIEPRPFHQPWKRRRFGPRFNVMDLHPFGTRHLLSGRWATFLATEEGRQVTVVEGRLTSPDHPALELTGAYVLARTAHLAQPYFYED